MNNINNDIMNPAVNNRNGIAALSIVTCISSEVLVTAQGGVFASQMICSLFIIPASMTRLKLG